MFGSAVSALRFEMVEILIEIQLTGIFPFENVALEIEDNCRTIGCFLLPLSTVIWTKGLFSS
jgi:hypothetical protein